MTNARTVLGVDPSIRRTGIARWRDGVLSTQTIVTNDQQDIEDRMRWICGSIWPLITRDTFVVLEAPYITNNGKTSMMLAGLHYVLRYGLRARGVSFGVVRPAELKQFACGTGAADKPAMVGMAAATYGKNAGLHMGYWQPHYPTTDVDMVNDEADALHCLTLGLHHIGLSNAPGGAMEPGLDAQQTAMRFKITDDWPIIEWEAP